MLPLLPRAPVGEVVALDAVLFNRIMDILSSVANLTVAPPLFLNEGPHGRTISFTSNPAEWFVLTSSATKSATYNVSSFSALLVSGFDPTASGTVAQSDVGASGNSGYAINVREIGKSTHDLDTGGTFLPMLFRGSLVGSFGGKPVYLFDGLQWENCS